MVTSTFIKYLLFVIEMRSADPWEARPIYLAYLNVIIGAFASQGRKQFCANLCSTFSDLLRLVTYVVFFLILLNYYSFPLHILRELFITASSFLKRLRDLIRARRATTNLNAR